MSEPESPDRFKWKHMKHKRTCGVCGLQGHNAASCPVQSQKEAAARIIITDKIAEEVRQQVYNTRGLLEAPNPPEPRAKPFVRRDELAHLRSPRQEG
jgi:hypothetical protein